MLQKVKVLGLTGGSGSGKSTAAVILHEYGAYIIDADKIARDIVAPGETAYKKIVAYFGNGILQNDGTLNRKKLAEIVFSDKEKLEKLNEITHSEIFAITKKLVNEHKDSLCVIDAPLLFDCPEILELCDKTAVVTADEDLRIERIVRRDGISEELAKKRIAAQKPQEYLVSRADIVWENNGNTENLRSVIVET